MSHAAFTMPRFYFHVSDGIHSFDDRVGEYQADELLALERALQMAKELRSRAGYNGFAIIIMNDDGQEVARTPISFTRQFAA